MLTRKKILLSVILTALVLRILFALVFSQSFFANYHLVPGLDMQTLLRFSEWQAGNETAPFFTFHRVWLFLVWFINGKSHCVWLTFIIQTLLGTAGCAAAADLVLKFTRNRTATLICGAAMALYLPSLVYEFSILQETFMVNFALLFFRSAHYAMRKRFSLGSSLLFASSAFAALAGRPVAIFFVGAMIIYCGIKLYKRNILKKIVPASLFLALLLGGATLFNYHFFGAATPFYMVLDYTVEYNTGLQAGTKENSSINALFESGKKAFMRLPKLFKTGELPENQNIYFWCEKIPQFHLLISPGLLIPCAAAGIMILLLTGAWKSRYGLLLIPVVTLALPLCAREVIGRYRLMLVPYFFMISACAAVVFIRLKAPKKRALALFGAGCGALFSFHNGEVPERIRLSDYAASAIAAAQTPEMAKEEIILEHMIYWEKSRFSSPSAFDMLMDQLLRFNETKLLRQIAAETLQNRKISTDTIYYYCAWSYALENDPQKVWENLCKIRKLPSDKQQKAIILLNDTKKMLNKQ